MTSHSMFTVVTTVQEPTDCMAQWSPLLAGVGSPLVVIGDKKGPASFDLGQSDFFSLERQAQLDFALAGSLPTGHYARKNLGYLVAMGRGAECIFETDDDNAPLDGWRPRSLMTQAQEVVAERWFNPYRVFCDQLIWPRGFPLGRVRDPATFVHDSASPICQVRGPIQQGLANLSPDVDAVWRLLLDSEVHFADRPSVCLPPGVWCPFNSQCTWWWADAYPLMYLPSYCSFRMTDIWRSFIAQRCLWELGFGVVFHGPEVVHERNFHDPMVDFEDEVPGYVGNERLTACLAGLDLDEGKANVGNNLLSCYEALVAQGIFEQRELALVRLWLKDVGRFFPV